MGNIRFCCAILMALVINQNSWALDHQAEIATAQIWANSVQTTYPILIFDRDELQFHFLSRGWLGDESKPQRLDFLRDYIQDKFGVSNLERYHLFSIDDYIMMLNVSAAALPLRFGQNTYRACAVFPRVPNGNQQTETERLTGLDVAGAYQHTYSDLSETLSREQLHLYSLYHEVSHCLDPEYLPRSGNGQSAFLRHQGEAFAETLAYFKLLERFPADVAVNRSMLRALYARFMGVHLSSTMITFPGDPSGGEYGTIYYLAPYLMGAYQRVYFRDPELREILANQDTVALIAYTLNLMVDVDFNSRDFAAYAISLTQGFESANLSYQQRAQENPELFYQTAMNLVSFESQLEFWTERAFPAQESTHQPIQDGSLSLQSEERSWNKLCTGLLENDITEFNLGLSELREQLYQTELLTAEARHLYENLENLPRRSVQLCPSLP